MAQKLWEKSVQVNKDIERFTVGRDREMDLYLAKHDVIGSMAHITMLESIGLLTNEDKVVAIRFIYRSEFWTWLQACEDQGVGQRFDCGL